MEIINKRRSVRRFSNKLIETSIIRKILKAGMQAPSAKNQQAWRLVVLRNKEKLINLSNTLQYGKMLNEANVAIIVYTDKSLLKSEAMYPQDMAALTQNILLAATSFNIGSCWIGIYPHQKRMDAIKEVINIKERYEPFSIIALGYPEDPNALVYIDRYLEDRVIYED